MSLIKTLAKLAIGVAAAKGISNVMRSSGTSGSSTGVGSSAGRSGGLGGMMEDLVNAGRGRATQASTTGGLGAGLDNLLGSLTGGFSDNNTRNRGTSPTGSAGAGGIGDLLKGVLGGGAGRPGQAGGQSGGIGDLLTSVLGGGAAAGGLGGLLGSLGGASAGSAAESNPQVPENLQGELEAAVMMKAMIMAVKADGQLDPQEKQRLLDAVKDAPEAEVEFINRELSAPTDLQGLLRQVPHGLEEKVYIASIMAIDLDHPAEVQYLKQLAQGLGISAPELAQIHDHLNLPHLS